MRITQLRPVETVTLDQAQLEALYRQLGPVGAEKVVNHALEELAALLSQVEGLSQRGHRAELEDLARAVMAVAQQIGLTGLAGVARDLTVLAKSRDAIALSAVLSRLERIGDRSLVAVWDLANLTV